MPDWKCLITGSRPDGAFTWRRVDADFPRGHIPVELAPVGLCHGSEVWIHAEPDGAGRWQVISCSLAKLDTSSLDSLLIRTVASGDAGVTTHLAFGQIRWTNVKNPIEDARAIGKYRPALLVSPDGERWRVMGFTTKNHYEDGTARVAIPDYEALGLPAPGYIWGSRLTRVDIADIGYQIGKADRSLLIAVLNVARADLKMQEIADMRRAISEAS